VVCRSVYHCKTAEPIEISFWVVDTGELLYVVQIPNGMGQFFWGGEEEATHCKVWVHFAVICAKTAEPIEMSFGL